VAKRALSASTAGLTWDVFAELAGIEPRAFKSYRMPEDSKDFRTMPPHARAAIEALIVRANSTALAEECAPYTIAPSLVIPALAALVMRLARYSVVEGRLIAGTSRVPGSSAGLTPEDRRALALVSRECLTNGLVDFGAEIHVLLEACTQPLGTWLKIDDVRSQGLDLTVLIHADEGVPTYEAQELAAGFSTLTSSLEEQLFMKLSEQLKQFPEQDADAYYTNIREFVVRNPICTPHDLNRLDISSLLWTVLQQECYQPVPDSWAIGGEVPICAHCHNAMRPGNLGLICRTAACATDLPPLVGSRLPARGMLRVSRGIRRYWVEPGFDEIRMFDRLRAQDIPCSLYPHRDRVDIAINDTIGLDLKSYTSPEMLGQKLRRSIAGLAYYDARIIVLPDRTLTNVPSYLIRLKAAAERVDVQFMGFTQAAQFVESEWRHA